MTERRAKSKRRSEERSPAHEDEFIHVRWDPLFAALTNARDAIETIRSDAAASDEERNIASAIDVALKASQLLPRPRGLPAARRLKYGANDAIGELGFGATIDGPFFITAFVRGLITRAPQKKGQTTTAAGGVTLAELVGVLAKADRAKPDPSVLRAALARFGDRIFVGSGVACTKGSGSRREGVAQCRCARCTATRIVNAAVRASRRSRKREK